MIAMSEFEPDLILYVTQEHVDGRKTLRYAATAKDPDLRLFHSQIGQVPLEKDPEEHFREFLRDNAQASKYGLTDWVPGRGVELRELLPEVLQHRLWEWRDRGWTILLISNEVWIPWEMLKLKDPDSRSPAGPFFAEAFSVTRWRSGEQPPRNLPLRTIATVIPQDSGLPQAENEREIFEKLEVGKHKVLKIAPVHAPLKEAMDSGLYDGWHFAGHGVGGHGSPHLWGLVLEEDGELTATQLRMLDGRFGQHRPLVFLNACFSGRGAASLAGVTGLASSFIEAGAGAFLGLHWAVKDQQAFCFAEAFYKRFFSGVPIGEAVRQARLKIRERFGGHGWLAYTVFAHPLARCVPEPAEKREAREGRPKRRSRPEKRKSKIVRRQREPAPTASVVETPVPKPGNALASVVPVGGRRDFQSFPKAVQEAREKQPQERVHEKTGMFLVYVPGGDYTLGDEDLISWSGPVHVVRLSPFWIGKYPVTVKQYLDFLKENPDYRKPDFWDDPRFNQLGHPVVGLSWMEAKDYCRWAGLDLPSEAQWEAAARGMDQRPYPWGKEPPTSSTANFGSERSGTTPVGAFPDGAGPCGTLDQAGNVWEWCADPWAADAYQQFEECQLDPVAREDGETRVVRGGSWRNPARDLHAAYRDRGAASSRFNNQGFRCLWRPT